MSRENADSIRRISGESENAAAVGGAGASD
jgi:hypothetical protein